MNIVLDQPNPTIASIKITLYEEDYQPQVEKKIKTYSKQMTLKGFRPGKVPPAIVKKMYGNTILAEEINTLLSESIRDYIQENDLNVVGDPIPLAEEEDQIDWGNQKEYSFSFKLGIIPPYDLDPSKLQVTSYTVDYTDNELQELIEDLRKRNGETIEAETSEEGDFLYGELKPLNPEEPAEEGEEAAESPFPKSILLPYNQLKDDVATEFLAKKAGDVIQFNIQGLFETGARGISLATGMSEEEAGQLEGDFTFSIERISRTELAEMNEDFYKKILGEEEVKDQDAFQERVRELVKENFERDAERHIMDQIRKSIGDTVTMEFPVEFLKEWLLISNDELTPELIEEQFADFLITLKWTKIQERIMREQSIEPTMEEIQARARGMIASQFGGQLPMGPEFDSYLDSMVKTFLEAQDGRNMKQVLSQVLEDKVLFYLREHVSVVEAETTRDEFEKLIYPQ